MKKNENVLYISGVRYFKVFLKVMFFNHKTAKKVYVWTGIRTFTKLYSYQKQQLLEKKKKIAAASSKGEEEKFD